MTEAGRIGGGRWQMDPDLVMIRARRAEIRRLITDLDEQAKDLEAAERALLRLERDTPPPFEGVATWAGLGKAVAQPHD